MPFPSRAAQIARRASWGKSRGAPDRPPPKRLAGRAGLTEETDTTLQPLETTSIGARAKRITIRCGMDGRQIKWKAVVRPFHTVDHVENRRYPGEQWPTSIPTHRPYGGNWSGCFPVQV